MSQVTVAVAFEDSGESSWSGPAYLIKALKAADWEAPNAPKVIAGYELIAHKSNAATQCDEYVYELASNTILRLAEELIANQSENITAQAALSGDNYAVVLQSPSEQKKFSTEQEAEMREWIDAGGFTAF
jgi:hypothetical protein